VVRISPRSPEELPAYDDELLVLLVRAGFSQRRKQLGTLLHRYVSDWSTAADALGFDRRARAETLSLDQWIALTNYIRPIPSSQAPGEVQELFPVVDDSDCVMYAAPRSKVHGDNLRLRAVHIFIFDRHGSVFLQKRSRWKDRHPLVWDSSAAGHVLAGEGYDIAARRELREELGVEPQLRRIAKLPASDRTGQEFIWLYEGSYEGELVLNRREIETGRYFEPAIVTGWIASRPNDFAPAFSECWKLYAESCR
jgi:16S rRNA (adenine1518-N6/adenine1519-N6)-dimethyltransferase